MSFKNKMSYFWLLSSLLVIAAIACNFPGMSATPDPLPTYAAQTVQARLTNIPLDTLPAPPKPQQTEPGALATDTPSEPTATNSPLPPTETTTPCDRAAFVTDVSVPDGTVFSPGESFTKTWRLKNTGTCTWDSDYDLVFKDGDSMSGPASKELTAGSVAPGQNVDISVDLEAPDSEGTYKGFWWLRNDDGVLFGIGATGNSAFFVEIKVGEPTATPYPILRTGKVDLDSSYKYDFDGGVLSPPSSDADLWFHSINAFDRNLEPQNGAQMALKASSPSLDDCMSASLSSSSISVFDLSVGNWICIKTNQGNYGRMEVESLSGAPINSVRLDYRIWDT